MQKQDIKIAINTFSNICRSCLVENEELESVYEVIVQNEQKTEQLDLVQIFKRYANVEIYPDDSKPQRVCKACITLLCQSYNFFEKCFWSNSVLDTILNENPHVFCASPKDEVEIKDVNLEETNKEETNKIKPGRKRNLKQEKNDLSKSKDSLGDDNLKNKPARKRVLKQEKAYFSESEDDVFDDNDRDDDSDWEPLGDEVKNNSEVKFESVPGKESEKDSVKGEVSEEELEIEKPTRKRNTQEPKQPAKKRGRPKKTESTENKKEPDDLDAIESQNKTLECKICDDILPDINTAIDHYDEHHAPQMEMDRCILCDKPKVYKKRDNLVYHMGLHSKDSIKCIPCRKYFKNKDLLASHLKECFKIDRTVAVKLEESIEDTNPKPDSLKTSATVQLSQKVLKETQYDGAFTCQLCDMKLGEIDHVVSHYENDHLQDLQCILCLRTFTKHVPLFHLGLHSDKSHVCRPCRLYFKTKEEYDIHYSKYDHDKSLACKICGKKFTRNYKKNKHMLSHLKEKNYSCNKCGKTFTYKTSLVRHFKMHFGKRFLCSSCGNAYTTKFMLQRHIRIMHTNVDADGKPLPKPPVKCEFCSEKFTSSYSYGWHLRTHPEFKPKKRKRPPKPVNLQCEFCGEIFKTKYGYGRHIRRHPEFKEFKCKICSFICDTREQLDIHMEDKHNKHTCDVCGKRFPFESELKTHHRKHEDMEMARFRCEICGKTARTQTQLKVHFRIHTGERPFSCELCGKSFKQTAHLKVHMFQHTGKMPYKCEICEKSFPFQHVMEIHMRTHTGEKPFQCILCGNAYHDRTTMQKHQKKKHPEMPIEKVSRSEYKMTKLV